MISQYILRNTWYNYFIITAVISFISGICNFNRFLSKPPKTVFNALRLTIYDIMVIYFGYLLIVFEIYLFEYLISNGPVWQNIVVSILLLVLPFYSVFCISGKGIEVLNRLFIDPGIKELTVSLGYAKIVLIEPKDE